MSVIDDLQIKIEADSKSASSSIDSLARKIDTLSTALDKFGNIAGIEKISTSLKDISYASQQLNNVKTASFTRLISNLERFSTLSRSVKVNGVNQIVSVDKSKLIETANVLREVSKSLNTISVSSEKLDGISQFASAIKSLGYKSVTSAIDNMPRLAKAFKEMMLQLSNAPKVSNNVIKLADSLAKFARSGSSVGTAATSISKFKTSADKASVSTKGLASAIGKLYASFWILQRALSGIGKAVTKSMDYLETLNYFDVTFNKIASGWANQYKEYGYRDATSYAESFRSRVSELSTKMTGFNVSNDGALNRANVVSLGMNPEKLLEYQANIASIADAIGMTGEASTITSKALTMLAGDLSSLKNVDTDQVMLNLRSGIMAGQTEAIDKYGISVREADLNTTLYRLGIDKTVSSLNQNAKAQLRIITAINQSKVAWGDLANTLNSPANMLRQLQNNFATLAQQIGSLALPAVASILPYINGIVVALQRLASWISQITGINKALKSLVTSTGDIDVSNIAESTEDLSSGFGSAASSAEKLNKQLHKMDELNNVTSKQASGGGGGSGTGGDLDLSDALKKAFDDYEKVWNQAYSKVEDSSKRFADKIEDAFKRVAKAAEPTTNAIKKLYNEGFVLLGNFQLKSLDSLWNNYLKPMGTWVLGEKGLARFFNITNALLKEINWNKLLSSLSNLWKSLQKPSKFVFTTVLDFYEHFLKPVAVWTIGDGLPSLLDVISKLTNKINWNYFNKSLASLYKSLGKFTKSIGKGLISFLETTGDILTPAVSATINLLSTALKALSVVINAIPTEVISGATSAFLAFFATFKGINAFSSKVSALGNSMSLLGSKIAPIAEKLFDFTGITSKIPSALSTAGTTISTFGTAISSIAAPVGIAVATFSGLSAILKSVNDRYSENQAAIENAINLNYETQYAKTIDKLSKSFDDNQSSLKELKESYANIETMYDGDVEYAKDLAAKYDELSKKTNLTSKEKEKLKFYVDELTKAIPILSDYIDEETGLFNTQGKSIQSLIEKQQALWKQEAYADLYKASYKKLAEAKLAAAEAQEAYNKILEDGKPMADKYNSSIRDMYNALNSVGEGFTSISNMEEHMDYALERYAELNGDAAQEVYNLYTQYKPYKKALKEATDAVNKANKTVNQFKKEQDNLINAYEREIDAANNAVESYKAIANEVGTLQESTSDIVERERKKREASEKQHGINMQSEATKTYTGYERAVGTGVRTASKHVADGQTKNVNAIRDSKDKMKNAAAIATSGIALGVASKQANVESSVNKIMASANSKIKGYKFESPNVNVNVSVPDSELKNAADAIQNTLSQIKVKATVSSVGKALEVAKGVANSLEIKFGAYKDGGILPEDGWFRVSHGEYFGRFDNGQSYIANNKQIEAGIAQSAQYGYQSAMSEEISLLRQQNELLNQILQKESGISADDIFDAVRKKNTQYYNQTGRSALAY